MPICVFVLFPSKWASYIFSKYCLIYVFIPVFTFIFHNILHFKSLLHKVLCFICDHQSCIHPVKIISDILTAGARWCMSTLGIRYHNTCILKTLDAMPHIILIYHILVYHTSLLAALLFDTVKMQIRMPSGSQVELHCTTEGRKVSEQLNTGMLRCYK